MPLNPAVSENVVVWEDYRSDPAGDIWMRARHLLDCARSMFDAEQATGDASRGCLMMIRIVRQHKDRMDAEEPD